MSRLLITLVISASIVALAPAAPIPTHLMPPPFYYYPTTIGARWVYHHSSIGPDGRDSTVAVARIETNENGKEITAEWQEDGKTGPSEKVLLTECGQFLLERGGSKFDPPLCVLKLPLKPGEGWEATTTFSGTKFRFKYKVLEPEWVRVPAGRFKAVPVVEDMQYAAGGGTMWPTTQWFVPEVGCIKATTEGGINDFMKSFERKKK